jgi:hypothetical protein
VSGLWPGQFSRINVPNGLKVVSDLVTKEKLIKIVQWLLKTDQGITMNCIKITKPYLAPVPL